MSRTLLLATLTGALALSVQAQAAAPRQDRFPLGQSAMSGAVCEAIRDDNDAAANTRGARAWVVRCRGWDTPLGRLYAYEYKGADALAGLHAQTLAQRAECQPAKAQAVAGVQGATRAACELSSAKVSYVVYRGSRGRTAVAAEGFAQIADVLESGLKIASGAQRPPELATTRVASSASVASDFGGQLNSLVQATDVAAAAPENLRERAYSRNNEWRFADAENDFRALAQNPRSPSRERAEAYLGWARNASNNRRFSAADALFGEADKLAAMAQDPALDALSLSFRALHLRNQRRFREAIQTAEQAQAKFAALAAQRGSGAGGSTAILSGPSGELLIGADLASALNRTRGGLLRSNRVREALRIKAQSAQALHTIATAKAALGDAAGARTSLDRASALLSDPELSGSSGWLTAQVEAELAKIDLAENRAPQAVARLEQALFTLRAHQAATPAEAYLMVELARAEAAAGDRAEAMQHFVDGFRMFQETRGSLGPSADSASAYFNLLLEDSARDPSRKAENAGLFFTAAESVGSAGAANRVAQLAARISKGDAASTGLARALQDTRRQVQLKTSELAAIQGADEASVASKAALETELRSLVTQAQELEQQLVVANPRYGALLTAGASLEQVQSKLRAGEIYVKTLLLADRGYGIAITREEVTPYAIDLTENDAARRVAALRQPFVTEGRLPAYDVAASHALFQALFGPVQDKVLAAQHVIYEPAGVTVSLPIAALATDQASVQLIADRRAAIRARGQGVLSYDGVAWLGKSAQTSLVVSAPSFLQSRDFAPSQARRNFLGFGAAVQPARNDPKAFSGIIEYAGRGDTDLDLCSATRDALMGLRPLREAAAEVRTVAQALGEGEDATVHGAVFTDVAIRNRDDLKNYRVLYFATHGLLPRPGDCLPEPALMTSVGEGDSDGLLDLSEITELQLDADLVVLSACDTGGAAGGEGGGNEALSGLAQAFIFAGARGLVVSHWQVDSKATVDLMTAMFRSGAQTQAEGLRRAALPMMARSDQYSHPYYWAAFTVVGDGARPMPGPALTRAALQ